MMSSLAAGGEQPSAVSVIIPTYNRSSYLRLCLEYLEAQSRKDFDVLVIDDGSTDDTPETLSAIAERTALRLRVITQPNGKTPTARNRGIAEARTDICIMIGDDMLVSERFVDTHLQLHLARPEKHVVGLGWVRWDTVHQPVSAFMQWQEDKQFDFAPLLAGDKPDWRRFYGSNFSCKTCLLRETPYDERFVGYGFDDVELGYRLTRTQGIEMVFLREAFAAHLHPTTFRDAARRMREVGHSEHRLHDTSPELREDGPGGWKESVCRFFAQREGLLDALTELEAKLVGDRRPGSFGSMLLKSHHLRGYGEYGEQRRSSL